MKSLKNILFVSWTFKEAPRLIAKSLGFMIMTKNFHYNYQIQNTKFILYFMTIYTELVKLKTIMYMFWIRYTKTMQQ